MNNKLIDIVSLMDRIGSHDPIVSLLQSNECETIWLTDSDFLHDDVAFTAMIERWEMLAEQNFITDDGQPSDMLFMLKQYGYRITPGEQDSSGWLTGIIHKGRLKYVFG